MSSEGKKHAKKNPIVLYIEESYQELRKVTWPTRNKAVRLTFLVLGVCLIAAVIIGALDFIFGAGHRFLLDLAPAREQVSTVSPDIQASTGQEVPLSADDLSVQPAGITATTVDGTPIQPTVTAESPSGQPVSVTAVDSAPVTVGTPAPSDGNQ